MTKQWQGQIVMKLNTVC